MEAVVKTEVELEDFGVMTAEWEDGTPTYNFRALLAYCERVGKEPADLSDIERDQFRTN